MSYLPTKEDYIKMYNPSDIKAGDLVIPDMPNYSKSYDKTKYHNKEAIVLDITHYLSNSCYLFFPHNQKVEYFTTEYLSLKERSYKSFKELRNMIEYKAYYWDWDIYKEESVTSEESVTETQSVTPEESVTETQSVTPEESVTESQSVTKYCPCGCGNILTGRKKSFNATCRQRISRKNRAF